MKSIKMKSIKKKERNLIEQYVTKIVSVFGKNCMGCLRHRREIMISLIDSRDETIADCFLTQKQAEKLLVDLFAQLEDNQDNKFLYPWKFIEKILSSNNTKG